MQLRLQQALNRMDPLDREVLVLRHFEELSNNKTAAVLGLQKSAASNGYLRALKRLKEVLASTPGFFLTIRRSHAIAFAIRDRMSRLCPS